MTMPIETVEVTCPKCKKRFKTQYRGSFNLELDPWVTEEYIREMTTGKCPKCGTVVDLGAIIAE